MLFGLAPALPASLVGCAIEPWVKPYERDRLGIYTMVEYEEREQTGSVYRAIDRGDIWDAFNAAGPALVLPVIWSWYTPRPFINGKRFIRSENPRFPDPGLW